MKLASFDIFDTTLLRRCGRSEAVFHTLAERLFPQDEDLCEAFVAWRKYAKGDTLKDIYDKIDTAFLAFASKSKDEIMQAEEMAEKDVLIANPSVCELIERRRKEGYHIAFISDMYLSSQFLRQVLERCGCCQNEDPIYVSCEHNARKDTGRLYDIVREALQPTEWIHYGDNKQSDIKKARRKGIQAIHIDTAYNDVEKAYSRVSSRLATLSRIYRLKHEGDEFAAFAADFVVPAYLPYAVYVLREARRMGIRKLYFLSRDSYILLKAAQVLTAEAEGIELHYLFVSRRSLLLPYLCGEDETAYLAASDHHTLIRIDTIDKRLLHLGTSREEMRSMLGIEFNYTKVNNIKEQEDFLKKIFHSDFTPLLQQRAEDQKQLLVEYFRQEGLLDGERCAAVDVGWLGTSRLMINHVLRRIGAKDMHYFYYGVRRDVLPPSVGRYSAYFCAEELSTAATVLLEHYYSVSPYPSTIGYQLTSGGKVDPLFKNGGKCSHTKASEANELAIRALASLITECNHDTLRRWAKSSIDSILNPTIAVDVTPLALSADFDDDTPFVKRLNLVELVRLLLLGDTVSGFDLGSLRLTLPHRVLAPAWRLHEATGRMRGFLYRRFLSLSL